MYVLWINSWRYIIEEVVEERYIGNVFDVDVFFERVWVEYLYSDLI